MNHPLPVRLIGKELYYIFFRNKPLIFFEILSMITYTLLETFIPLLGAHFNLKLHKTSLMSVKCFSLSFQHVKLKKVAYSLVQWKGRVGLQILANTVVRVGARMLVMTKIVTGAPLIRKFSSAAFPELKEQIFRSLFGFRSKFWF